MPKHSMYCLFIYMHTYQHPPQTDTHISLGHWCTDVSLTDESQRSTLHGRLGSGWTRTRNCPRFQRVSCHSMPRSANISDLFPQDVVRDTGRKCELTGQSFCVLFSDKRENNKSENTTISHLFDCNVQKMYNICHQSFVAGMIWKCSCSEVEHAALILYPTIFLPHLHS